jgi:methionyl-tRNA synthetase
MPYYVTTPIYYVNGEPHLGHVYTTVAADVLARHMRQRGEDVFFLTGTDEHGEPVAQAAEREGVTPRELADRNAERFREVARRVDATNDFFIRTSDEEHKAVVAEIVTRLKDNGYVYEGTYEGWYCPRCADFKTDSELVDGNKCPIHLIVLEREKEDNWFFKLSAFQERLEQLYADRPEFVLPSNRYNEALSFITGGLRDFSLSRARITWGVPVPWDPDQVVYVWIDALLNYYSALAYARPGEDLTERFWPATVHVIAKDILKFHAVFWPALLMAAEIEVPERVFIHGYLLMDDHKMSKSLGNVLDPFAVMDVYGTDALRYYLMREVAFGQDGSISTEGFETRYNTELANEYGNLASRTLAMVGRYRDGVVPEAEPEPAIAETFAGLEPAVRDRLDAVDVTGALEEIWERVRALNRYVQDEEPWKVAKDESRAADLERILYTAAEGLRVVSVLLHPFVPTAAEKLLEALGQGDTDLDCAQLGARPGGAKIQDLGQLFPKIEPAKA